MSISNVEKVYSRKEICSFCREVDPDIPIEIVNTISKIYETIIIEEEIQKLINKLKECARNEEDLNFKVILFSTVAAEEARLSPKVAESTLQSSIPGFISLVLDGLIPEKLLEEDPNNPGPLDTIFSYQGDIKEGFSNKKEKNLSVADLCHIGFAQYYFDPKGAFEALIKLEDKIDKELLSIWLKYVMFSMNMIDLGSDTQRILNNLKKKIDLVSDEEKEAILELLGDLQEKYNNTSITQPNIKLERVIESVNELLLSNPESLLPLRDPTFRNVNYGGQLIHKIRQLKILV